MTKRLVLYNKEGNVLRVYPWKKPETLWVVFRKDTRRLEVMTSLDRLKKEKVPFETLARASGDHLLHQPLKVGNFGHLELVKRGEISPVIQSELISRSSGDRKFLFFSVLFYLLVGFLLNNGFMSDEVPEEVEGERKREIVRVVHKKLEIPRSDSRRTLIVSLAGVSKKTDSKADSLRRRGAFLAALGQLKKGHQRGGGLDMGNVQSTSGPGVEGHQEGGGGVQTSIYGEGLVAAPLGSGSRVKGGGGYGTKGKGGGKAGFGSLSMVGSTGVSMRPVSGEASVGGGLDHRLVADVVRRHLGQIRFCYEQGLQLNASLSGRVVVFWVIDANGRVRFAKTKDTSLNNKSVEDCLLRRLRTWKFPIPGNNREVKVSFPFRFNPFHFKRRPKGD